jgi:hypothetical protein
MWLRCYLMLYICASLFVAPTFAQATVGEAMFAKLTRGGYISSYQQAMTREVASNLIAATDRWSGVQVNGPHRRGWINIYLVDADRLLKDNILAAEGVEGTLHRNALTHEESATIFIDTGLLKAIAASTYLKQTRIVDSLEAGVAKVQVDGLDALRQAWEPRTLAQVDEPTIQKVNMFLRGTLTFIIAHEMGHAAIGRPALTREIRAPKKNLTERERDEIHACPELSVKEHQQQQQIERRADEFAAGLLSQQCDIGNDGPIRHQVNLLGANWYFLYAMSDKLLAGARATQSPNIRRMLIQRIGPELYTAAVEHLEQSDNKKRGAVHAFFPSSHPPDVERINRLEAILSRSTCGSSGIGSGSMLGQLWQSVLTMQCQQLKAKEVFQ